MTLKLRTHEEIQEYLLHPSRSKPLKRAAINEILRIKGGRTHAQTMKTDIGVSKILLRAAFGHHALKGRLGKHLQALGEFRRSRITKTEAQELGELLATGGQRLRFAIQLDPDQLMGLTDKEKHAIVHKFENTVMYIQSKGNVLKKIGRWRPKR